MSKEKNQITQKNGQFIFVLPSGALQHRQSCFPATHSVGVKAAFLRQRLTARFFLCPNPDAGVLVLKQTLNLVVGKKIPDRLDACPGKLQKCVWFTLLF